MRPLYNRRMEQHLGAEARTALAMAGSARAPLASGLTFVPSGALAALSRAESPPAAVADACERLALDFAFVDASRPEAAAIAAAVSRAGTAVMWAVRGPLGRALDELGWVEGLAASAADPLALAALLEERLAEAVAEVEEGLDAGVPVLVLADDIATGCGPLVPPDFAFDEVLPRLARAAEVARAADVPCVLHSDGDIRVFVPAIERAGFSAVHCGGGLDFDAFERLYWAARAAGLAVFGGLLTSDLSSGHMTTVSAGTRLGVLSRAGGLLVCDDGGMTEPAQMSMFVSALQAVRAAASGSGS